MFLNWLRLNRSRFTIAPRVLKIRRHAIDLGFSEVTPAMKFCLEFTATSGPWIAVDMKQPDGKLEGVIRFYGAEYKSSEKNWTSLALRPEEHCHWETREELWLAVCFEPFLAWCNEHLLKYFEDKLNAAN